MFPGLDVILTGVFACLFGVLEGEQPQMQVCLTGPGNQDLPGRGSLLQLHDMKVLAMDGRAGWRAVTQLERGGYKVLFREVQGIAFQCPVMCWLIQVQGSQDDR